MKRRLGCGSGNLHLGRASLLAALTFLVLLATPQVAFADDCADLEDCLDTSWVGGVLSGVASAIAGGAIAAGVSAAAGAGTASAVAQATAAPPADELPPMVMDERVVSGEEAIQRLTEAGAPRDGDCVLAPDHWAGDLAGIRGIGYETRPHPTDPNKRCIDPGHVAIVVPWPHPADPPRTSWIEPGRDLPQIMRNVGFDPRTVTDPNGRVHVISPENLPENVSGLGHGDTWVIDRETGQRVLVINGERPVVITHWPVRQPPVGGRPPAQVPPIQAPQPIPEPPPAPREPRPEPPTVIREPPPGPEPGREPEPPAPTKPPDRPKPPIPPQPQPPSPQPPPEPAPRKEKEPERERQKTNTFRLRMVMGGDMSVGVIGGSLLTVEVQEMFDGRFGKRRYFTFAGIGPSVGLKASPTGPSAWKEFRTIRAHTVEDFGGPGMVIVPPQVGLIISLSPLPTQLIFWNAGRCSFDATSTGLGVTVVSVIMGYWMPRGSG